MAKQRKNQSTGIHFGPVVKVVILCFLFCGSAVGYVWQKNEILRLGRQISDREKKLAQLKDQNDQLRDQYYLQGSQRMIALRVQQSDPGLGPVQPWQVVRLEEPSSEPAALTRQLAGRPPMTLAR